MIAHGAFGKSKLNRVNTQPILNEAGIAKAQRNKTIFNRAILLVMRENSMTREDVLHWLDRDDDPAWQPEAEKHPFTD